MNRLIAIGASATLVDPAVAEALSILKGGGVIAFPTETFYGLAADAANTEAIEKIFRIKGRHFANPISLICAGNDALTPLVQEIPPAAQRLMETFWPGPLTLLFAAAATVSPRLTAGTGKIGIRVSSHPVARFLADGVGGAVTATSANRSGHPECMTAEEASLALGLDVDAIITGPRTTGGLGSTILDVTVSPPKILREGVITRTAILAALDMP